MISEKIKTEQDDIPQDGDETFDSPRNYSPTLK